MPSLEQNEGRGCPFGETQVVPLVSAEVRDAGVVPHLSFVSITSAVVWTNLCQI